MIDLTKFDDLLVPSKSPPLDYISLCVTRDFFRCGILAADQNVSCVVVVANGLQL